MSDTLKRFTELRDAILGALREARAIARRHNVAVSRTANGMTDAEWDAANDRIGDSWEDGIIGSDIADTVASDDVRFWFGDLAEPVRIGERWIAAGKGKGKRRRVTP